MFRCIAGLFWLGLCAVGPAARAADADPLVGSWQADHDGYREVWTIAKDKDDYTVGGVFTKKGDEVGSFKGDNVQVADGKLTCTQNWLTKPDPTWADNTKLSATAKGDKLTFTWDNGGQSGTRDMARVKAAAADGADLIGKWKVDHDGYTEAWDVRMEKGKWAVKGIFIKRGKQVGAWVGTDAAFADGKLTCTQKYLVKPEASWSDGTKMTAESNNDKFDFTWDNGNGQTGTREMTRFGK